MKCLYFCLLAFGLVMGGDMLKKGQEAPDFALPDQEGKIHRLSDYRGKIVILYFYPKDFTPGCTAEACNLRDNFESLQKKGIEVLGVSFDDVKRHRDFSEKYSLPFPLLADTAKTVARLYGAKGGLTGILFAKRITYIIDENGKIMHVIDKVNTQNHARQILDLLDKK